MDFYYIMRSLLFDGLSRTDVESVLKCLRPEEVSFARGEVIYRASDRITKMGMLLSGAVRVETVDAWGGRTLLIMVEPGKTFAESNACAPVGPVGISFTADKESSVLMFDVHRIMRPCSMGCEIHRTVASNFTRLLALRNIELSRRVYITSARTIREKVQLYLSLQAHEHGAMTFEIPLNREQMANYLGVDRSALSAELSRMQKEGLIEYRMRRFTIADCARVDE